MMIVDKSWFSIDLQLFAEEGNTGEKTEKATPRRREEARKKGQVFKSTDLNSAIIVTAGSVTIFLMFPYIVQSMQSFTQMYLLDRTASEFSNEYVYKLFIETLWLMAKISLPIMGTTAIAALVITFMQVGFVSSGEALSLKLERLNLIEGARKIFSKRALVELTKSLLKITIIAYIVYSVVRKYYYLFPRLVDVDPSSSTMLLGDIVFEMAVKTGVVLLIIGALDYLYQRYEYETSLKMSKYDVKQEYKQTEGDPLLKSRQRQIQRDMAMRRMMSEVPHADVIITNPTHFAVALQYQAERMEAPVVIAKGQDLIALKIKEIAGMHNIVVVENPPLARTIFYHTRIGDMIPEELFQAVAEVLAFVYRQKKVVL